MSTVNDSVREQIVAELKRRFPEPWFTKWYVRDYHERDHDGKKTDEIVAYQAFVKFIGSDLDLHVTLVLETLPEIAAAIQSLPSPAPAPAVPVSGEPALAAMIENYNNSMRREASLTAENASLRAELAERDRIGVLMRDALIVARTYCEGCIEECPQCVPTIDAAIEEYAAFTQHQRSDK